MAVCAGAWLTMYTLYNVLPYFPEATVLIVVSTRRTTPRKELVKWRSCLDKWVPEGHLRMMMMWDKQLITRLVLLMGSGRLRCWPGLMSTSGLYNGEMVGYFCSLSHAREWELFKPQFSPIYSLGVTLVQRTGSLSVKYMIFRVVAIPGDRGVHRETLEDRKHTQVYFT